LVLPQCWCWPWRGAYPTRKKETKSQECIAQQYEHQTLSGQKQSPQCRRIALSSGAIHCPVCDGFSGCISRLQWVKQPNFSLEVEGYWA
jgi:hypothetical protein